ncbi:MAG: 16S rRNA (cytosine(1402)-N(4))-methyltransferase RsmH [Leptolyngbya sp. PLA3]|nr:MAG: 16S rRNA (cytosine(1402)-N(4))-methyltransferase RsmH [Cyanobacteria bacterium CYA]MCE7967967.1 16S rRNA (cytosine(1402)-N(4))-methyltransferase RsmH [Leptolyngbya sp. PL-A3]
MDEVLAALEPRPGQTLVDCTAGLGGHSARIAERLGPAGRVVLFDLDPDNLARATEAVGRALGNPSRVVAVHGSFAWIGRELTRRGLVGDLLLADLGFASNQMDDPQRGFSFRQDGPLDMRLDPSGPVTAADLVSQLSERELADLIFRYGEDRLSRRIARAIAEERQKQPMSTTGRLASVVEQAYPPAARRGPIHAATRTFQALRIAVNDEIGNLESLLAGLVGQSESHEWLSAGARVAIISFHSLEDRPVKQTFAQLASAEKARLIHRKVVFASESEITNNARARSARLRALELL